MKKQSLLGAIALTTIAAGAAGAANAQQYTVVPNATTGATSLAPVVASIAESAGDCTFVDATTCCAWASKA